MNKALCLWAVSVCGLSVSACSTLTCEIERRQCNNELSGLQCRDAYQRCEKIALENERLRQERKKAQEKAIEQAGEKARQRKAGAP